MFRKREDASNILLASRLDFSAGWLEGRQADEQVAMPWILEAYKKKNPRLDIGSSPLVDVRAKGG